MGGNQGNDILFTVAGDNTLRGGQTEDTLVGGSRNDVLFGDKGNDLVYAGAGNNFLTTITGDWCFSIVGVIRQGWLKGPIARSPFVLRFLTI